MKTYSIILRSLLTEKSSRDMEKNVFHFKVSKDATKVDIKQAIKDIYGVDVEAVNMMILPSKTRALGKNRIMTKRGVTKKAVVKVKEGQKLDPNKFKELKKK